MSITPIEMYTMAPKSQEASNQRQGEIVKDASRQADIAQRFGHDIQADSQRTVRMKESDSPEYRYDQKDGSSKGKGSSSGKQKKQSGDKKKEQPSGYTSGGFDIRI